MIQSQAAVLPCCIAVASFITWDLSGLPAFALDGKGDRHTFRFRMFVMLRVYKYAAFDIASNSIRVQHIQEKVSDISAGRQ